MFQKTYLINSNFYKQYHDSRSFMLNRLFKTRDQNETMRQAQASFIQMPPNNYIYNAYSNTIKPILVPFETRPNLVKKENVYERDFTYLNAASNIQRVKYKEIQSGYYDCNKHYNSHYSRPKVQNNFENLITNDSFSFRYAAKKTSKINEISKNAVDKISKFGLKHNIEALTPKINAYKQPAKVSTTVENIYTQTRTKPIEKLMKIDAYNDTSAFKPVKNPNEIIKISASNTPKGNQEIKINLKQNRLVQKAKIETKKIADDVSNLQPAYFQPIQPAGRLLLKKKLSQPRTELEKLLLSKNPRLPPPFSKTTKLYEHQKNLTQIETKKSNNYKDLKSIGFKIFRENVYVKDSYEKFPHSILDYLIKKSNIEKETLKFKNKSPSINLNVVSNRDAIQQNNQSTTGKKHSETEILIDRYLHKQRA